jgi:calcineurin-like phosphoesterase family protein
MTTWYTSDLHFGHERIIELCHRPFSDVDDMNRNLIANWNAVVADTDTVWILGDLAMGNLDDSLACVAQLKGHKLLVPGNHDRVWAGYKSKPARILMDRARYERAGLRIMPSEIQRWIRGTKDGASYTAPTVLCHFPQRGDSHEEDRYAGYRPRREPGEVVLCGHVHNSWKTFGPQINVGVDVWDYAPVSEDTLAALCHDLDFSDVWEEKATASQGHA